MCTPQRPYQLPLLAQSRATGTFDMNQQLWSGPAQTKACMHATAGSAYETLRCVHSAAPYQLPLLDHTAATGTFSLIKCLCRGPLWLSAPDERGHLFAVLMQDATGMYTFNGLYVSVQCISIYATVTESHLTEDATALCDRRAGVTPSCASSSLSVQGCKTVTYTTRTCDFCTALPCSQPS